MGDETVFLFFLIITEKRTRIYRRFLKKIKKGVVWWYIFFTITDLNADLMHDAKRWQKKVQNKIVSKWVLVWHLSNLETFTQRVQRYFKFVFSINFSGKLLSRFYISARAGWKFPNSTNVKLELISKRFYFELFFLTLCIMH